VTTTYLGEALENRSYSRDNDPVIAGQDWSDGWQQLGFSDYELTTAKKQAKWEKFLAEMEAVVSWQALIDLIEP
jgi:hypothetical protein